MLIDESRALRRAAGREGCVRWVRGYSKWPKRSGWDRAIHRRVKRNRSVNGVAQVRGKSQHIEHSEAAADRGLRVAERIPGEADAGFKIVMRRIAEQRRDASTTRLSPPAIRQGISEVPQAG